MEQRAFVPVTVPACQSHKRRQGCVILVLFAFPSNGLSHNYHGLVTILDNGDTATNRTKALPIGSLDFSDYSTTNQGLKQHIYSPIVLEAKGMKSRSQQKHTLYRLLVRICSMTLLHLLVLPALLVSLGL